MTSIRLSIFYHIVFQCSSFIDQILGSSRHPKYKNLDHDIAIIKTVETIRFGKFVQPACLPSLNEPDDPRLYANGTKAYISGWGSTMQDLNYGVTKARQPNVLQAAVVMVRDFERCQEVEGAELSVTWDWNVIEQQYETNLGVHYSKLSVVFGCCVSNY